MNVRSCISKFDMKLMKPEKKYGKRVEMRTASVKCSQFNVRVDC